MATWASLLDVLERNWDLSAEVQATRARPPQRHAARLREAGSPPNRRVELVWGFGFEAMVEGKWETPEDLTTPNQFGKLGETRDERFAALGSVSDQVLPVAVTGWSLLGP